MTPQNHSDAIALLRADPRSGQRRGAARRDGRAPLIEDLFAEFQAVKGAAKKQALVESRHPIRCALGSRPGFRDNAPRTNRARINPTPPLRAPVFAESSKTEFPSLSLESTSPPWSADATPPECGHCWRRPKDSEPPGHGAHPGPMCRAAENHSRNPS